MMKQYKTPAVQVVKLDDIDIFATSTGDNESIVFGNSNPNNDSKAPSRSPWGDD